MGRGVRQGDPFSPFLFILAAEGLNVLVNEAVDKGIFDGVDVGREKILVSHLQYADDTIFFDEWSKRNANNLMCIMKGFEKVSGLKVVQVGVSRSKVEDMVRCMECSVRELPLTYLGLPIGVYGPMGDVVGLGGVRSEVWGNIVRVGRDIDRLGVCFSSSFTRKVGDGSRVSFWDDRWVRGGWCGVGVCIGGGGGGDGEGGSGRGLGGDGVVVGRFVGGAVGMVWCLWWVGGGWVYGGGSGWWCLWLWALVVLCWVRGGGLVFGVCWLSGVWGGGWWLVWKWVWGGGIFLWGEGGEVWGEVWTVGVVWYVGGCWVVEVGCGGGGVLGGVGVRSVVVGDGGGVVGRG
ncbi:kinase-like domain, beta-lactamase/transpeptidase-like protein [Tanacetum coccineum]|uniref:Kinase-like domain, beta-lactamase/transpeptidase-like protein n=1 Tax=Tanacetum coccineum TaxID=301880 RepID=A0ABQ4Z4V2_9ASTR